MEMLLNDKYLIKIKYGDKFFLKPRQAENKDLKLSQDSHQGSLLVVMVNVTGHKRL